MSDEMSAGSTCSRREFGRLALAALPLPFALLQGSRPRIDSSIQGVQIGLQSFSLRRLREPDAIIAAMVKVGIGSVELMSNHAEAAAGAPGDAEGLRGWRTAASTEVFERVRRKFNDAGIEVALLCYPIAGGAQDDEIEYAFRMAKALGVKAMTTSTQVSMAKRIAPFAEKHRMRVGFHNHHHGDASDPDEIVTPESFAACLAPSQYHGINLDVGHFTAANFDSVSYIEQNHARITNIHLKDRRKNAGAIVPWGTGDAPLKGVLQLMRAQRYAFPANIEYEYPGADPVAEVAKCYEFCRTALA
jgi:sugar phosphate isomerase/epimerase